MKRYRAIILAALSVFLMGHQGQAKGKQLQINITAKDIDLHKRTIGFKINKPIAVAEVQVTNLEGQVLSEQTRLFNGEKAGTPLTITWPEIYGDPDNFKVELKVTDVNDFWVGFEIVRFYGDIPHEEVNFESGKWDIPSDERPKLDAVIPEIVAMVQKFQKFSSRMEYALYIAGHTDTVGSIADNRKLSLQRARAIASYLRKNGLGKLKLSIYVRGFGEETLAVSTPDNTPEKQNRRADYIVSNFPPAMSGPGHWQKVK